MTKQDRRRWEMAYAASFAVQAHAAAERGYPLSMAQDKMLMGEWCRVARGVAYAAVRTLAAHESGV